MSREKLYQLAVKYADALVEYSHSWEEVKAMRMTQADMVDEGVKLSDAFRDLQGHAAQLAYDEQQAKKQGGGDAQP